MFEAIIAVIGTIVGIIIGFWLSIIKDSVKNKKETKQILPLINNEIYHNLFAIIHKPEKSYFDALRIDFYEIFKSKLGSLSININQVKEIVEIYQLFERIDTRKRELKEIKKDQNSIFKGNDLNEFCSQCNDLIFKYQKKYDKKNSVFK